jgi:hypothetical protein
MNTLYLILYVIAGLLFLVAAVTSNTPNHPLARVNLIALGLFAWVLVPLIQRIDIMNN